MAQRKKKKKKEQTLISSEAEENGSLISLETLLLYRKGKGNGWLKEEVRKKGSLLVGGRCHGPLIAVGGIF